MSGTPGKKAGTIIYDSSLLPPSTMAQRKKSRNMEGEIWKWKGRYGKESGPIDILSGWDESTVQRLVEIIEEQTHTITSVLLNQKEPVEILQVINLVGGLSRALRIVVQENSKQAQEIASIKIALGVGQNHQRGQLKSDIKF